MYITLNHDVANVSYSYSNNYSQTFSILDHILLSKSLTNYIASYNSSCDDLENQSDHAPVVLSLNIYSELHMNAPRKKWNTASHDQIDAYKSLLDDKLSAIDISNDCLNCDSLLCTNYDHAIFIQQMHDDIIAACIDASDNIPTTREKIKIYQVGMSL